MVSVLNRSRVVPLSNGVDKLFLRNFQGFVTLTFNATIYALQGLWLRLASCKVLNDLVHWNRVLHVNIGIPASQLGWIETVSKGIICSCREVKITSFWSTLIAVSSCSGLGYSKQHDCWPFFLWRQQAEEQWVCPWQVATRSGEDYWCQRKCKRDYTCGGGATSLLPSRRGYWQSNRCTSSELVEENASLHIRCIRNPSKTIYMWATSMPPFQ